MNLYYKVGKNYEPKQIVEKECFSGNMSLAVWCLSMRNKYNIKTVIETGTNFAKTTEFFINAFKKVYTIDIQESFTNLAKKKFSGRKNIECMCGDSSEVLISLCTKIPKDEVVLIFLDAHGNYEKDLVGIGVKDQSSVEYVEYYPENAPQFCPLMKEIDVISQHLCGRCVLVVDDVPSPYRNPYVQFGEIKVTQSCFRDIVTKCFQKKYKMKDTMVRLGRKKKSSLCVEPDHIKKGVFITARMGSKRLPGKHLLKINDQYCIEHIIERVKKSKYADRIVLCTTLLDQDTKLCEIANKHGIDVFRGSVIDKLDRWRGAVEKYDIDFFVTADADDLFCDPGLIDMAFDQCDRTKADFIEWDQDKLICGAFTYGINSDALRFVCDNKRTKNTEMMWGFFDKDYFKKEKLQNVPEVFMRPEIRATLDYEEDFKFFKEIYAHMKNKDFTLEDVVSLINDHPEIIKINIARHNDWKKNQQEGLKHVNKNQ